MNAPVANTLQVTELESLLAATDPAVLLVPPRILRRLSSEEGRSHVGLEALRERGHIVDRDFFAAHVDVDEWTRRPAAELPARLILLCWPTMADCQRCSRPELLRHYWRLLFHARLQLTLSDHLAGERSSKAALQHRIERVGRTEFAEARQVLRQEGYLDPVDDDWTAYIQLAAVLLTFTRFAPHLLPVYFPALRGRQDLAQSLREGVDVEALLVATRLPGASDAGEAQTSGQNGVAGGHTPPETGQPSLSVPEAQRLNERARRAEQRGNLVGSALLHMRLARRAGQNQAEYRAQAQDDLRRLAARLQEAVGLSAEAATEWYEALVPLLEPGADGFWPVAAQLLYDLQKVCVDHEHGLYRTDLRRWLLSFGKQPLRRPVPSQRVALEVKHLRSASRRLPAVAVDENAKRRLARLLDDARGRAKQRLRDYCQPRLAAALEKVGLVPANLPEQVARDKLQAELLDVIVQRGLLSLGLLRDAIARNQLKLPDLSGPGEFLRGDKLLRLDRELAQSLEGIYHRGEFYLRWFQSGTSLLYSTPPGRLFTRFVLLPFGGAFVVVVGARAIFEEAQHFLLGHHGERFSVTPTDLWVSGLLGVFFLLLNIRAFRDQVVRGLHLAGRGVRLVFQQFPAWLLRQPAVRAFLRSTPVVLVRRYLLKPALFGLVTTAVLLWLQVDLLAAALSGAGVLAGTAILLSTRPGRTLDEMVVDWLVQHGYYFGLEVIPAILQWVMDAFKWIVSEVERFLYTVDQWLRFHRRESNWALVGKAVLALIWSAFAYVVRFLVILILEPTFNPVKHVPVVTLAAKLLLPVYVILNDSLGMNSALASALLFVAVVGALPGVFGFLVWELKESWRLYQANRPAPLRPVLIGSHGETMSRFLRPGFHSGTLPKWYGKWRRAERRGRLVTIHTCRENLHHVAEALHHFCHREFVHLLHSSRGGSGLGLAVGHVFLAVQSIEAELTCVQHPQTPLTLAFELKGDWLRARLREPGWLKRLTDEQRQLTAIALEGLFKLAGIELLDEQLRTALAALRPVYDVSEPGLVVWPEGDYQIELVYDLEQERSLRPTVQPPEAQGNWPVLDRHRVVFAEQPLTWAEWVEQWEKHQAGKALVESLPAEQALIERVKQ